MSGSLQSKIFLLEERRNGKRLKLRKEITRRERGSFCSPGLQEEERGEGGLLFAHFVVCPIPDVRLIPKLSESEREGERERERKRSAREQIVSFIP